MEVFYIITQTVLLSLLISHMIDGWVTENRKKKEESEVTYKGHHACKNCGNSMSYETQVFPKFCPFCGEKYGED